MKKRKLKKIVYLLLFLFCFVLVFLFFKLGRKSEVKEDSPNEETKTQEVVNPQEDPFVTALKKEKYYIEDYLERYLSYSQDKDISASVAIRNVNSNLDREMYTDTEQTDISVGNLMLVNKYYYLKEDFEPDDLVTLNAKYNSGANSKMRKEAAEHFMEMSDAALLDNISIKNASGYRSYTYQVGLYNRYVQRDGKEAADTYSARPGYSEHQTGLVSDINIVDDSFEKTPAFRWLQENAYKYGFILRFPKDKEYITGYKYESWHYRYVGVEVAKQMHEEDLTLEEYYAYYVRNK